MKPKSLDIKEISIVMPSYKAEKFIEDSITRLKKVLDENKFSYEIICVVDGTKFDKTFEKASKMARHFPGKIKVLGYEKNMGKGHAVRFGMVHAKYNVIGYIDAGNEINPDGLPLLLEHMKWYSADAIVASKRHPASKVNYPWQRRILSFWYQMLVRILFGLKVRDTQVGMKFYKREMLEKTLPRLLVKAFAFDIELLAVAKSLGFNKVYESPVEINMEFGGGVSTIASKGFLNTTFKMVWDTLAVFYRLKILHYYSDKNKANWTTPDYLSFPKK